MQLLLLALIRKYAHGISTTVALQKLCSKQHRC